MTFFVVEVSGNVMVIGAKETLLRGSMGLLSN